MGRWSEKLGFTPNERRLLLILIGLFLLGAGLKLFRLSHEPPLPKFTYASADSEFASRSAAFNDSLRALHQSGGRQGLHQKGTPPALGSLNINTATRDELRRLPGIGDVLSGRIVARRARHGRFRSIDDLKDINGIHQKTIDRVRPYLRLK